MRKFLRLIGATAALFGVAGAALAVVTIDIDLSRQRMSVADAAGDAYDWAISSGRAGHRTPTGTFRPIALYPMVHSAKYGNAPMPHSIFFLKLYAIHGTDAVGRLGSVASHGCIRLAPQNAATLYRMVEREGAVIRIHGAPPDAGMRLASTNAGVGRALAYAPRRRSKSLDEWALDPAGAR